ncbi:MAG: hypothetical protein JW993_02245 [Sedimentisphaerales bacterium]|nr:hypothetical protein [Sedimentisphaerales bacterium]
MGIQARHVVRVSLLIVLTGGVFLSGGCGPKYARDKCLPRGPWQSPTIHSMRSLLLINSDELRVVYVDGEPVEPTFVAENGFREYHLLAGAHTVTAVFRYDVDIVTGVSGQYLTLEREFLPGHAYVAVYREHEGEAPEPEYGVATVTSFVIGSPPLHWSLEFIDVDDVSRIEPEVEQARAYNAWVIGITADLGPVELEPLY